MKRFILVGLLLSGCVTGEKETAQTAYKAGFTDVSVGDLSFLSCVENDKTGRSFVGTNVQGVRVQGVVCCGVAFKNCAVRY